jgi:hypothetical protein
MKQSLGSLVSGSLVRSLALLMAIAAPALAQTPAPKHPPPPARPPVARNRPPTVRARCEPCMVYLGKTSTVTADAQDPDGDRLTYTWGAPAGSLTSASARRTPWRAPMVDGPVPVFVRVDDGKGGSASDVVTIQVIKEAVSSRQ